MAEEPPQVIVQVTKSRDKDRATEHTHTWYTNSNNRIKSEIKDRKAERFKAYGGFDVFCWPK